MKKTKLIQVLSTFDRAELLDFERVLKSSGFHKSNPIFKLWNLLKKEHPEFPEKKIDKSLVFKRIFGKAPHGNTRRLTDIISHLNLAVQNYLIDKKIAEKEAIRAISLLEVYEERSLDKLFFSTAQQLINKWEKKPLPGRRFYSHLFELYSLYCYHPNYTPTQRKEINLSTLIEATDLNYIIEKLYITNLLENNKELVTSEENEHHDNIFIDHILELVDQRKLTKVPIIHLLKELIIGRRLEHFDKFEVIKNHFISALDTLSLVEKNDFISCIQRYCYEAYVREGTVKALEEIHTLNKLGVEQDIFIIGGYISNGMFRGIVQIGCAVNDFAWVEYFMKHYETRLKEEQKDDLLTLSKAILLSRQGKYEAALQELIVAKPQDLFYDIQLRCIILQCYYELDGYEETLDHYLNAFAAYISRNKLMTPSHKQTINNLIRFTYLLVNARNEPNPSIPKIQAKLDSYSDIPHKSWLNAKVKELTN